MIHNTHMKKCELKHESDMYTNTLVNINFEIRHRIQMA